MANKEEIEPRDNLFAFFYDMLNETAQAMESTIESYKERIDQASLFDALSLSCKLNNLVARAKENLDNLEYRR